jgi:predicted flavoprotein YhiN
VNWLNDVDANDAEKKLKELKQEHAKKRCLRNLRLTSKPFVGKLVLASGIEIETKWADLSKHNCKTFQLTNGTFQVNGKSTFKEEFVTAGGINLKSQLQNHGKQTARTCICGEIVNIDAITGGFNFQNAWTSGLFWRCYMVLV